MRLRRSSFSGCFQPFTTSSPLTDRSLFQAHLASSFPYAYRQHQHSHLFTIYGKTVHGMNRSCANCISQDCSQLLILLLLHG